MKVPKVFIIDTNVLVSGFISSQVNSPTVSIVDAMLNGSIVYLMSADLLQEYRSVLLRPKLCKLHKLNEHQIDTILSEITANAVWHEVVVNSEEQSPDPGDYHLWNLLATESSAILVTGDQLLLANPPKCSSVISPTNCIKLL